MDLLVMNGFSILHIIEVESVRFRILSVFSPTIFSTKLVSLGHPTIKQSAKASFDDLLIPFAILKSTLVCSSTSVSDPEAYLAILSRFCLAWFQFLSANSSFGTTLRIFNGCGDLDRKSTRLNSSHVKISYAVFC